MMSLAPCQACVSRPQSLIYSENCYLSQLNTYFLHRNYVMLSTVQGVDPSIICTPAWKLTPTFDPTLNKNTRLTKRTTPNIKTHNLRIVSFRDAEDGRCALGGFKKAISLKLVGLPSSYGTFLMKVLCASNKKIEENRPPPKLKNNGGLFSSIFCFDSPFGHKWHLKFWGDLF